MKPKQLLSVCLLLLAFQAQAQTLDCQKFRTGTFTFPQLGNEPIRTVRKPTIETTTYPGGLFITWNLRWTSDCTLEMSFVKQSPGATAFRKGDRLVLRITAVTGDCCAYESTFYNARVPGGEALSSAPTQMCLKRD